MISSLFINSLVLGVGLAMDAFSVSLVNGLVNRRMSLGRMARIALVFGIFQFAMPLTGWSCVHTAVQAFRGFSESIPWIACLLLLFLGGKMIVEAVTSNSKKERFDTITFSILIIQGIATSIDALSVGFTIPRYGLMEALTCSVIIGIVTFLLSVLGLKLGKMAGTKYSMLAGILGGAILIFIGISQVLF